MLRKGPEQVPDSWLVLLFALMLMQFSSFVAATLISLGEDYSHLLTFITHLLGMAIYTAILLVTGMIRRIVPILSAVIACGAILTLLFVAAYVMLNPFLGKDIAVVIATLIIIWSVPVEGHIIARGIEQHWYVGIVIAMIVFTLQYFFQSTMTGRI
jgi:peptidoglycan/LPS O-acetylase OafA/YrhL